MKQFETKKNKQLDKDAAEAKALGLSYGEYSAYKASGYLEKYKAKKHDPIEGKSYPMGGRNAKRPSNGMARKIC